MRLATYHQRAFALFVAVLFRTSFAAAEVATDKVTQARAHYEDGVRKFNLGKLDEAAGEFQAAYELSGNDDLLFNVAQTWRLAKKWERARFFYKAYLAAFRRRGVDPPERELAEQRIAEVSQQLETMQTSKSEPKVERAAPVGAVSAPTPVPRAQPTARPRPRWLRPLGLAVGSLGLAGLVTGAALVGVTLTDAATLQNARGEFTPALRDKDAQARSSQRASTVLFAAGGALVGVAAVLLAVAPKRRRSFAVAPLMTPGGASIAVRGQF
jgi:hypothetical protein